MSKSSKARTFKVWAAIDERGELRHIRTADYREPVSTLRWLGYQPAILTLERGTPAKKNSGGHTRSKGTSNRRAT